MPMGVPSALTVFELSGRPFVARRTHDAAQALLAAGTRSDLYSTRFWKHSPGVGGVIPRASSRHGSQAASVSRETLPWTGWDVDV